MIGQLVVDRAMKRRDQLTPLRFARGIECELVRQLIPVPRGKPDRRVTPEMAADLVRHLEDHELVGPGRKAALATKLGQLARNRHQRVCGRLMSKVIEFRTADAQYVAAATNLAA